MNTVSANALRTFTTLILERCGLPPADAAQAADVLIAADLRGVDSHGVARLPAYVENLQKGAINPTPIMRVIRETFSTATVDADNGLGLVMASKANAIAIDKAKAHGSGWVAVRNSSHFGIAGYYSLQAAEYDLIGWTMTNTSKVVAPLGSVERMLGTNPIAVAIPAMTEKPIVIDMSTSVVSWGKIEIARRTGNSIPLGWAIDEHGQPTTNPDTVYESGSLSPLGGSRELGGHKGYCLTALVDLLTGVMSGANWGPFVPPFVVQQESVEKKVGLGIGHLFGAMRIDGFIDVQEFKSSVDQWIQQMRNAKPIPGTDGPLIPGDPEWEAEKTRRLDGIPLHLAVYDSLCALGNRFGIKLA